jgi:hypothetical protein
LCVFQCTSFCYECVLEHNHNLDWAFVLYDTFGMTCKLWASNFLSVITLSSHNLIRLRKKSMQLLDDSESLNSMPGFNVFFFYQDEFVSRECYKCPIREKHMYLMLMRCVLFRCGFTSDFDNSLYFCLFVCINVDHIPCISCAPGDTRISTYTLLSWNN